MTLSRTFSSPSAMLDSSMMRGQMTDDITYAVVRVFEGAVTQVVVVLRGMIDWPRHKQEVMCARARVRAGVRTHACASCTRERAGVRDVC